MNNCLFCKIIAHEIPAQVIAENDHVVAIKDIHPKAPIHYLIVPKKHVADVQSIGEHDFVMGGEIFKMAQQLSKVIPGAQAFRLLSNNGKSVGQSVFHIHVHFLAGKEMFDF